jgi:uncharacterized protein YndB with AHSA1/START domain
MAISVTIETTIAQPPEVVFARLADLEGWPTWLIASGVRQVERPPGAVLAPGMPLRVEQQAAGRAGRFEAVITAFEPLARLALQGKDRDGVTIEMEALIRPAERGTDLRWSIRIGLPFRYRMFEGMARPQVERAAALDIEALRIGLESAPTD